MGSINKKILVQVAPRPKGMAQVVGGPEFKPEKKKKKKKSYS
jgi:hypothetical protein